MVDEVLLMLVDVTSALTSEVYFFLRAYYTDVPLRRCFWRFAYCIQSLHFKML